MKKILLMLLSLVVYAAAVILPVTTVVPNTYDDVTTEVQALGLAEAERFTIYNDSGSPAEAIADGTGVAVIDSTYNNQGIDIISQGFSIFSYDTRTKYYVRAKQGTAALIKLDKNGPTNVHDVDFHKIAFNEFFHEHTGVTTVLDANVTAGDINITVANATGIIVGTTLQIENGVIETTLPVVTDITGAPTLILDRPLDNDFTIGDSVEVVSSEIKVNATIASPRSFKLIPDADQTWHIVSLTISLVHAGAGDDSKFGDAAALLNGLVFRGYNGATGKYRTFTNWKDNGDIGLDFGEVVYTDKAGSGLHGTKATASIKFRAGAVPSISGANGDYLEVLVQDLLLTLLGASGSVKFKGQGHVINL